MGKMKRILALMVAAVCMLSLCACGDKLPDGPAIGVSDVKGTWTTEIEEGTQTVTFYEDMVFDKTVVATDSNEETYSEGRFFIDGNKIEIEYTNVFGVRSKYAVWIEGDYMTWDDGESEMLFVRQ